MKGKEFWRWSERSWRSTERRWYEASAIVAGVDVGSVSSKAVVLVDGKVYAWSLLRTGHSSPDSAVAALRAALEGTDLPQDKIAFIVGTGYGRVNIPFADRTMSEISCHARGANFVFGDAVRTVLDIGGQDCKAIRCDAEGRVKNFVMNDKCAAGTGRGMEVFADILGVSVEEMGEVSLRVQEEPAPVSATCVVFARSEALSLLRNGWSKEKVAAAYCAAMSRRLLSLLKRVGVEREVAVTGGLSKNEGVVRRLEGLLGFGVLRVPQDERYDAQIVGALGAALFAHDSLTSRDRNSAT